MISFIDYSTIFIKGGNGGNGCVAFRRERNVPKGGPSGGNGGNGGSVIFIVKKDLGTLLKFRYQKYFRAEKGQHGKGSQMHGRKGADLIITVPCGTVIKEKIKDKETVIADMVSDGNQFVASVGGSGGKGNTYFKSSTNQAPRQATPGKEMPERLLILELKLIADVGLAGYPNSGKSTLLSVVSKARPKIAAYPFTTISPNLGIVGLGQERSFVMADIPGLIDGASQGKGLGHLFLRHVERTSLIVHIIDLAEENIIERYNNIRNEFDAYSQNITAKKEIIVGNKIDLPQVQKNVDILKKRFPEAVFISALTGEGVKELLECIWKHLKTTSNENPADESGGK